MAFPEKHLKVESHRFRVDKCKDTGLQISSAGYL